MGDISKPEQRSRDRSAGNQELSFTDIVQFFRRNAALIFGTAFAVGLLTAAFLLLAVGKTYEASATLVIVPPRFSSELKPATLTVQSYQEILQSDAVIVEAKKRLVERGLFAPGRPPRPRHE